MPMTATDPLALVRDPRLSPHATSALPVWLWADGATEILWANPPGAAVFGETAPAALAGRTFEPGDPAAQQIARLAGALPQGSAARLERLRGFGAGVGRMLVCRCARIALPGGRSGILVAAAEPAGPSLSLAERVRRLFAGNESAFAAFSPDGALLQAGAAARPYLGSAMTLADAGAGALATEAQANGHAAGDTTSGTVTVERIGTGNATILLATFAPSEAPAVAEPAQAEAPTPVMTAAEPAAAVEAEVAPPQAVDVPSAEPSGEPEQPAGITQDIPTGEEATPLSPEAPDTPEAPAAEAESAAAPTVPEPIHEVAATADETAPVAAIDAPPAAIEPTPIEAPIVPAAEPVAVEAPPPAPERRYPLRFVWQTDAEERFTFGAADFVELLGPSAATVLGRPWSEIAAALALDPDGRVARALASRDTWSGIAVAWPVDGSPERLTAELSGLPVFDRDRAFRGYRGFGVCRDVARMNAIAAARQTPTVPPVETVAETPPVREEPAAEIPAEPAPPEADIGTPAPTEQAAAPEAAADQPAATDAAPTPDTDEAPAPERRPQLTLVPAAENVVPFRTATPPAEKRPTLTPVERTAFQDIAKALGGRPEGDASQPDAAGEPAPAATDASQPPPAAEQPAAAALEPIAEQAPQPIPSAYAAGAEIPSVAALAAAKSERAVLDRVPVAVLVYRGERLLYANHTLLDWTGYENVDAIAAAGGIERLFAEPGVAELGEPGGSGKTLAITTRRGAALPVEARLFSMTWAGETALLLVLTSAEAQERVRAAEHALQATRERVAATEQAVAEIEERVGDAEKALHSADERLRMSELALRAAEAATRELESVLDTATDGVIVVSRDGVILASNRSVEALFGYDSRELSARSFVDLFAQESQRAAHDYLAGLTRPGVASVLNDGREVIGRVAQGGLIPLFMTIGRIADGTDKFCVVFRDITQWKRAEEELTNAKREAEKASSAKSDFLAKVSHEIRTPLNAIIGFSEVMMDERFGAIGNDRYRQYLKDIHASGELVISLVNDLLDLSKIEAGKLELNFTRVELNDVVQQCVAIMQPQANRERIIIRTSLSPTLPPVVADERSVRQIVLNLLSNSIKFTGAGGQVIVSTAVTDQGEEVLRVRDTGIGMTEKELETALEPFRQVATSGRTAAGTGLGLPLTKALAEANRASFTIKSAVEAGTLVEIAFPPNRVLAE